MLFQVASAVAHGIHSAVELAYDINFIGGKRTLRHNYFKQLVARSQFKRGSSLSNIISSFEHPASIGRSMRKRTVNILSFFMMSDINS